MDDITIFNLRAVNKGALNATVSIRLGNGLTIHDCKIIQQDGVLSAKLPQRPERQKGGEVVYHDLVDFADPKTWPAIALQLVVYYQAANEKAQSPDPENPASEDISRQEEDQSQPTPEPDIQAILTILGRRPRWYGKGEDRSLDLRGTDIRGADLRGAHLEEAILDGAHLEGRSSARPIWRGWISATSSGLPWNNSQTHTPMRTLVSLTTSPHRKQQTTRIPDR